MADRAKGVVKSGARLAIGAFFEYDTPKIVHIQSKKVGFINRIIQVAILAYIIGYAIVWEKGYQDFDTVESAALTKLKGVIYTNLSEHIPGISNRIWDVADIVEPPEEADAVFVTTNVVFTPNQTQDKCDEDPNMIGVLCDGPDDCEEGKPVVNGNGVRTGNCVPSTQKPGVKVCEIYAWCPVEVDQMPLNNTALLEETKDFTLLIKNWIEFPKFNAKRRNIIDSINNDTYLKSCHYRAEDPVDKFCPIFKLKTIVKEAGQNYSQIALLGGVIAINIDWNCNLDYNISYCQPHYSFHRLDDADAKIAKGWNFRYANYYTSPDGQRTRELIKAYGIRFVIKVSGTAGKFSVVPLLLNLGSGLALLAIATVICDIIVLYILKKGDFYKDKKYLQVVDDDAFQVDLSASHEDEGVDASVTHRQPRSTPPAEGYTRLEH